MAKTTTKKRVKRRGIKKRPFRRAKDVPEWASMSVKRTITPAAPVGAVAYNTNQLYSQMNTQLVDFERASNVAGSYQHYRMKKITITFKPSFDNFLASGGAVTKPYLYWMIDKSGSVPTNITVEGLKQMGAKPIQLDEKPLTISWRPSVLEAAMYAPGLVGTVPAKYKISPWLSTQAEPVQPGAQLPSGIDHLGLYWYVDCLSNPAGIQYTAEIEVQFQFKKPLTNLDIGAVAATPSKVAERNDSPDGVVGGGDGR